MSWRSPFTVPMTTVPRMVEFSAIISGLSISRQAFMALAESSRLGTNALPSAKSLPIASIAGIMLSSMICWGSAPPSRAACTSAFALIILPL